MPKVLQIRAGQAPTRSAKVSIGPELLSAIDSYAEKWACTRDEAAHKLIQQAIRALDHANKRKRAKAPGAYIGRLDDAGKPEANPGSR